jgi:hypothetical protein
MSVFGGFCMVYVLLCSRIVTHPHRSMHIFMQKQARAHCWVGRVVKMHERWDPFWMITVGHSMVTGSPVASGVTSMIRIDRAT